MLRPHLAPSSLLTHLRWPHVSEAANSPTHHSLTRWLGTLQSSLEASSLAAWRLLSTAWDPNGVPHGICIMLELTQLTLCLLHANDFAARRWQRAD